MVSDENRRPLPGQTFTVAHVEPQDHRQEWPYNGEEKEVFGEHVHN